MLRKVFRKLHLILGLTSGLVVFIVGLTGAIYCWEEDVRDFVYSDLYAVNPDSGTNNFTFDELMKIAKEAHPKQKVRFIRIFPDSLRSVEFGFKDKESVFVNYDTKEVLGSFNRDGDFFGVVQQIHRRLMLGDVGEMITGISCLIFAFMLISGMYLWWPRSKSLRKQRLKIALKAPKARKIFDLHSVLGFYASWILIFSVVTGLVWSFKWFEGGMYALVGSEKKNIKITTEVSERDSAFTIDKVFNDVYYEEPTAEEYFISLPDDSIGTIRVNAYLPQRGFFKEQNQYYYNQYTGALVTEKYFEEWSAGDKMKSSNLDIHTGRKFGFAGKLIMFFVSLIAASLPVTGFLYWRIRQNARKQSERLNLAS